MFRVCAPTCLPPLLAALLCACDRPPPSAAQAGDAAARQADTVWAANGTPPPAPAPQASAATPRRAAPRPQPAIVLVGTVVTPQGRYAVVAPQAGSPARQWRVGERMDRWELTRIEEGRIEVADASTVGDVPRVVALQVLAPAALPGQVAMQVAATPPARPAPPPRTAALPVPTNYTEPEVVVLGH